MADKRKRDYLAVDVKLSPTDLMQLEAETFVGDPIRRAVESAAKEQNREVNWETLETWVNKRPTDHNGITIRVFVKAPEREDND